MMKIGAGARLKFEGPVEVRSLFVNGVDQDRSKAEDVCCGVESKQGVFEQGFAEALTLLLPVYREPTEQADGDWLAGLPFGCPAGRFFSNNTTCGDGVVSNDPVCAVNGIGA